MEEFRYCVREAERLIATALGSDAAQDYLKALRRRGQSSAKEESEPLCRVSTNLNRVGYPANVSLPRVAISAI